MADHVDIDHSRVREITVRVLRRGLANLEKTRDIWRKRASRVDPNKPFEACKLCKLYGKCDDCPAHFMLPESCVKVPGVYAYRHSEATRRSCRATVSFITKMIRVLRAELRRRI